MSCKVIFTDTARSDLLNIARSLAENSKDKALAVRFVRELQQETARLEQFPESGAVPRDRVLKSGGDRFLVHGDYLLFYLYEKEKNAVYVMAVFNGKRDSSQQSKGIRKSIGCALLVSVYHISETNAT